MRLGIERARRQANDVFVIPIKRRSFTHHKSIVCTSNVNDVLYPWAIVIEFPLDWGDLNSCFYSGFPIGKVYQFGGSCFGEFIRVRIFLANIEQDFSNVGHFYNPASLADFGSGKNLMICSSTLLTRSPYGPSTWTRKAFFTSTFVLTLSNIITAKSTWEEFLSTKPT